MMKFIKKGIFTCIISILLLSVYYFYGLNIQQESNKLELSNYVTIIISVPESHAEILRETMAQAGAGKMGNYSHCSYSQRGIGRFMPNDKANPYLGSTNILETVVEERIETICSTSILHYVLEEIKRVHPYEELVIDIYPIYTIGLKSRNSSGS